MAGAESHPKPEAGCLAPYVGGDIAGKDQNGAMVEGSPLFSEAERAALDYVSELTRDKKVKPSTFAAVSGFYSERAICEIVWLVASEHLYNITNLGLNIDSDMLCEIHRKAN
jgi:alkylhydroperoxidase family enzyme